MSSDGREGEIRPREDGKKYGEKGHTQPITTQQPPTQPPQVGPDSGQSATPAKDKDN